MDLWFFYVSLGTLALISLIITRAKPENSLQNYFLVDRQVGLLPLTMTFLATQVGGGLIVGTAEWAYRYGWQAVFYPVGIAAGFLSLALGLGARFRRLNVATMPELLLKSSSIKAVRPLASLVLIFSMFGILLALGVATRKFFIALGISNEYMFVGIWVLILLYTSRGGLQAVVKTDVLQIGFLLVIFVITAIYLDLDPDTFTRNVSTSSLPTDFSVTRFLFLPMFFTIIGQDMGQRCFAAKNEGTVARATALAAVLLMLSSCVPIFLGLMARESSLEFSGASVLIKVVQMQGAPWLAGLFACAILMAILSTVDSLLCAISANISYDLLNGELSPKYAQIITFFVGVLAILLSFNVEGILEIIVEGYALSICTLLIPIIGSIKPQANPSAANFVAMIVGLGSFLFLRLIAPTFPEWELVSIGAATLAYLSARIKRRLSPSSI